MTVTLKKRTVNKARGEVALVVGDKTYVLCLTLGAIAAIEDGLGITNIAAADEALASGSSRTFAQILSALIAGGSGEDISPDDIRRWPLTMTEIMTAISGAFGAGRSPETAEQDAGN